MSAPLTQLDSRVRIVTPENIAFEYRVAGPFARIGAYLVDLIVITGFYAIGALLVGVLLSALGLGGLGLLFAMASYFLLYWFYGGAFEALWSGQTPGKRMTGLRTLRTDGRPITASQAILRNLLRFIDLMPFFVVTDFFGEEAPIYLPTCLIGLTAMACTRRYQRLGDLACGTMVVAEEPIAAGRAAHDWFSANGANRDESLQKAIDVLPANYRPGRSLSRALSHYASRRRYFGPARRREIARHVGAVLVDQLELPPDTDHDLLLAPYARTFLSKPDEAGASPAFEEAPAPPPAGPPPFNPPRPPTPTAHA